LMEQRREERHARMEERMGRRIDDMVNTYGLSDAQRQLLEQVMEQRREYFRARRNGEEVGPYNFDAALQGIMNDDQFSRYLEDTQEDIYNRAEMMATTQSVRLRQVLDLPQEQSDLVFDTIHYTAQEAMIARQSGEEFDMRTIMDARLAEILTPEQMQVFSESQTGGPGMGPGMGGGMGPGRGRPPGG
jgi:ribosomal protein L22